jgi:hypothetical protein
MLYISTLSFPICPFPPITPSHEIIYPCLGSALFSDLETPKIQSLDYESHCSITDNNDKLLDRSHEQLNQWLGTIQREVRAVSKCRKNTPEQTNSNERERNKNNCIDTFLFTRSFADILHRDDAECKEENIDYCEDCNAYLREPLAF